MSDVTPIEDGHADATPNDKLDGIVEQMLGDVQQGNVSNVADALRQRLDDTGVVVSEAEFDAIVAQLNS